MDYMSITQVVSLALIIVPGLVVGVVTVVLKQEISLWLIVYGFMISLIGVMLATVFGKELTDVLLLIDTGGFGRSYLVGCMLIFSGIVAKLLFIICTLWKKLSG